MPPPVIDTSPLIFLTTGNYLHLLQMLYPKVCVPQMVAKEVRQYGEADPAYQSIQAADWLIEVDTPAIPQSVQDCGLDPGESAVLAWAKQHSGTEAILDDLASRRCAQRLGIPVRGTLGLVLVAKQRGHIPAARPVIANLKQAGMYLSDRVINQALALVGE
jgi:predicted nucleic acid-binding protein